MSEGVDYNEFGLTNQARSLWGCLSNLKRARETFADAKKNLDDLEKSIKDIRIDLGKYTTKWGATLIHIHELPGYAFYFPAPPTGYTDYEIKEQIIEVQKVGEFKERPKK